MKVTQIRNATLLIEYRGKKFLIDPMLSPKGSFPGFPGTFNSQQNNPTVELPLPLAEIIDVDAVIVTHVHPDHWDETAQQRLPKSMPMLVQNAADRTTLQEAGFSDVRILEAHSTFADIRLSKTSGQHGRGKVLDDFAERLGEVSGVVFSHPQEKTLYIAGDTVWNRQVAEALAQHCPDVVVLNSGEARIVGYEAIIMGKEDVLEVYQAAPQAVIIASHMEAVNHAALTRAALRTYAEQHGMLDRLRIPRDGESYTF